VRSGKWERAFDRYELNAGIGYQTGKWSFDLHGKYLFGRSHASSSTASYGPENIKPAFYTTLNIRYQANKKQEFYLRVENLLDRDDICNNSSAEYYYTPFNFVAGYSMKF
jgi:outer membrane receptor protein involved in Fe transport